MINKERVELLAQALESDRYRRCTRRLRVPEGLLGNFKWTYCALGVAIRVALDNGVQELWGTWMGGTLPNHVTDWYGFDSKDPLMTIDDGAGPVETSVSGANDDGADFWTIAQALRATYLKDE